MRGPLNDTELTWLSVNGRPAFKGVLGGYPRLIIGETREELETVADDMRANRQ